MVCARGRPIESVLAALGSAKIVRRQRCLTPGRKEDLVLRRPSIVKENATPSLELALYFALE